MEEESIFPHIKRSVGDYLFDEEGDISRGRLLTIGSMFIVLSMAMADGASAGHRSHSSHSSHSSGYHTHSSHSSGYGTHGNYSRPSSGYGTHSNHSSHSSHSSGYNTHSSHSSGYSTQGSYKGYTPASSTTNIVNNASTSDTSTTNIVNDASTSNTSTTNIVNDASMSDTSTTNIVNDASTSNTSTTNIVNDASTSDTSTTNTSSGYSAQPSHGGVSNTPGNSATSAGASSASYDGQAFKIDGSGLADEADVKVVRMPAPTDNLTVLTTENASFSAGDVLSNVTDGAGSSRIQELPDTPAAGAGEGG